MESGLSAPDTTTNISQRDHGNLEQLYAQAPFGMFTLDREMRFVRVNKQMADLYGTAASQIIGATLPKVIPDMGSILEPILRHVLNEEQSLVDLVIDIPGNELAHARYWLLNCYPLRSKEGEISGLGVVVQDITEKKVKEAAQAQGLQFQAKQTSRVEAPVPVPVALSEAELQQRINAFPTVGKKVAFAKKRDGLTINGRKLLDPEGSIKFFGFDQVTGDVTYLVSTGPDTFSYKYVRATTGMEPVKITDATFNGGWQLTLVTGKKIGGDKMIPLGRGFVITRDDGSGFVWSPDKAMQNFNAPEGFQIADFQNGDIGGTRYILCERMIEGEESSSGSFGKLLSATKNLGSTLGINNKEDYLLLNIDSGAVVSINISYDKKNVAVHSNCQATSSKFVNKCANVQFYDSLYDETGNPNRGHYFWAINWYNTSSGTLLLFMDNNGRELYAQNLTSNKKASILSRMLGINWFTSTQKADGTVSVVARMGFSDETVNNVESALAAKAAETVSQK